MMMPRSWSKRGRNSDGELAGSGDTGLPAPASDSGTEASGGSEEPAAAGSSNGGSRGDASKINARSATTAAAVDESDEDEIQQLSDDLRRALECPVCMELSTSISTCCNNGHGICDECAFTMNRMNPGEVTRCPLCRSPPARQGTPLPFRLCRYRPLPFGPCGPSTATTVHYPYWSPGVQPPPPPTIRKLSELMSATKVACSFRPEGCPYLMFISAVVEHEALCPYASQVRCMVAWCQWMGAYNQVFRHVSAEHHFSAYEVSDNRFVMPDLTFGLRGAIRRMYLIRNVRDGGQLYWVGMARPTNRSTHVVVLKVMHPDSMAGMVPGHPNMSYRVRTINNKGWYQARGRPRPVCWDRTVLRRAANAMDRGVDRETCMSALNAPPWCVTSVYNEHQYDAIISWNSYTPGA